MAENKEDIRKRNIRARFNSLKDTKGALHSIYKQANPAVWIEKLLEEGELFAEEKILELERRDVELSPSEISIATKKYAADRNKDLLSVGITRDVLIEALARKIILDDPSLAESIEANLLLVDNRNQKP